MKRRAIAQLFFILLFVGCFVANDGAAQKKVSAASSETAEMFDESRNRKVPVIYYHPAKQTTPAKGQQLVVINHGYGENKPNSYLAYSYIGEGLAAKGYFVVSIQHELPTDELIPDKGKPQVVRMPFWERGAANIRFVLQELEKKYPQLDYKHVTLIGHSNGGDMVMLFAQKYPGKAYKIISLDNRRMSIPRVKKPKLYTLRSNDYSADEGVLPAAEEQKKYGITVRTTAINHNNMCDIGSEDEKKMLLGFIEKYLEEK